MNEGDWKRVRGQRRPYVFLRDDVPQRPRVRAGSVYQRLALLGDPFSTKPYWLTVPRPTAWNDQGFSLELAEGMRHIHGSGSPLAGDTFDIGHERVENAGLRRVTMGTIPPGADGDFELDGVEDGSRVSIELVKGVA